MPTVPVLVVWIEGPCGYLNRKFLFVELPLELLALCRGGFSVANPISGNVIIAWPDKLGISPIMHDGSNVSRSGKQEGGVYSAVRQHQNEQADAETYNSRDELWGANGDSENTIFPV